MVITPHCRHAGLGPQGQQADGGGVGVGGVQVGGLHHTLVVVEVVLVQLGPLLLPQQETWGPAIKSIMIEGERCSSRDYIMICC